MNKSSKPDCIVNPATGRAVKSSGSLGKKILKQSLKKNTSIEHNCTINPKTDRAVRTDSKLGKILTKDLEKSPSKSESNVTIFLEDEQATSLQKKSYNNYTLDNRLDLYNDAVYYLDKISSKECLKNVSINDEKYMALSDKLILDKQIGTKSKNGSIFLSYILEVPELLVVSKLTNKSTDNYNEAIIMEDITNDLLIKKKTKHFPLLYSIHLCEDRNDKKSLVTVNELCNGDLKTLLNTDELYPMNEKLFFNLLFQVFVSLATYQNHFKSIHNDTHYGNFLYQHNNEKGHYKYEINNSIFYLKSCPYNIMLYDFGLSKNIKDENLYIKDYYRIMHAFIPESEGGWNKKLKAGELSAAALKIKQSLKDLPETFSFATILNLVLMEAPIDMFTTNIKNVKNLLNTEPYII